MMTPTMRRLFASLALASGLMCAALPALAQPAATCGDLSTLSPEQHTAAVNAATASGVDFSTFHCTNLTSAVSPADRSQYCVSGLCEGGTDIMCCRPDISGRATPATGGTAASTSGTFFHLVLPTCITSSVPGVAGNCSLDDIVRTGVNFANFLFGISGAILLATFVYGGVLYITAGSSGNVGKAKDMIKNALIGMVLVFGAGALVTTIYDTFRADTGGRVDACTTAHPTFSCQYLSAPSGDAAAQQAEMTRRGCVPGLCAGGTVADSLRRCCPTTAP